MGRRSRTRKKWDGIEPQGQYTFREATVTESREAMTLPLPARLLLLELIHHLLRKNALKSIFDPDLEPILFIPSSVRPFMSRATFYRALDVLIARGFVRKIGAPRRGRPCAIEWIWRRELRFPVPGKCTPSETQKPETSLTQSTPYAHTDSNKGGTGLAKSIPCGPSETRRLETNLAQSTRYAQREHAPKKIDKKIKERPKLELVRTTEYLPGFEPREAAG